MSEKDTYIFDTEPLVAFLTREPGHNRVAELLDRVEAGDARGWLARTNAAEILYILGRINGADGEPTEESLRDANRTIRALNRHSVVLATADWQRAGRIKAHGGLSLADAHAVALAEEMDATLVVGSDPEFDDIEADVEIERIRDGG